MGSVPDFSHFRVWGCTACVLDPSRNKRKLDPKSSQGYFMAYSSTSRAWRIYLPATRKIVESAHVRVDERKLFAADVSSQTVISSPEYAVSVYVPASMLHEPQGAPPVDEPPSPPSHDEAFSSPPDSSSSSISTSSTSDGSTNSKASAVHSAPSYDAIDDRSNAYCYACPHPVHKDIWQCCA
jgi:hypothetical protein